MRLFRMRVCNKLTSNDISLGFIEILAYFPLCFHKMVISLYN